MNRSIGSQNVTSAQSSRYLYQTQRHNPERSIRFLKRRNSQYFHYEQQQIVLTDEDARFGHWERRALPNECGQYPDVLTNQLTGPQAPPLFLVHEYVRYDDH